MATKKELEKRIKQLEDWCIDLDKKLAVIFDGKKFVTDKKTGFFSNEWNNYFPTWKRSIFDDDEVKK